MKKFRYCFILGFLIFLFPNLVFANTYSLTVVVETDDLVIENAQVSIYRIGNVNDAGILSFSGEFLERNEDLNHLTSSETKILASKLVDFIHEKNIAALSMQATGTDGTATFSLLEKGVYLLDVSSVIQSQVRYDTSPTILVLPITEQAGSSHFQIKSKTETVNLDDGNNGNTVDSPSTYDSIVFYVLLAVVSFVGIIIYLSILLKRKNK